MTRTTKEPGSMNNNPDNNNNAATNGAAAATTTSTTSSASDSEIQEATLRLADELRPYVPSNTLPENATTSDLQLTICRKLRELLPSNKDLLHTAQDRLWIPTLLTWLNLHDRPAVQVEALLALTNIAELCAQQSYLAQAQQQTSAVAAAAQAAVSAVKGWNNSSNSATAQAAADAMEKYAANAASASSKFAASYPGLMSQATTATTTPAPGSVPFPPLSFSQTLSPEAVAAFDASLTSTISGALTPTQQQSSTSTTSSASTALNNATTAGSSGLAADSSKDCKNQLPNLPASSASSIPPLFPSNPTATPTTANNNNNAAAAAAAAQGINFSSLAPPPGGAHTSVPSNAFLPPPTPVTAPNFPQQLSASSQHLLLRHADAIPTLISLLSSPNREVYEQAVWILGSIAAGDSPGAAAAAAAAAASNSSSSSSGGGGGGGSNNNNDTNNNNNKSVSARDVILAAGIMSQLLRCLEAHPSNLSLQRIGSWTLSNLVDGIFQQSSSSSATSHGSGGKSAGSSGKSSNANNQSNNTNNSGSNNNDYSSADEIDMNTLLPVLRRLLRSTDSEVLGYTCWTLSHLCDGPSSHIAAVVTTADSMPAGTAKGGLVPRLVELLMHPSWRVTKPSLRTIGNIVCAECSDDNHSSSNKDGSSSGEKGGSSSSASTDYTEVILECDAVPRLRELVTHGNREIQKEACWTLSNIAAGTVDQIQAVIDSGAIPPLVQLVRDKKTDQEVRSEACWVVLNATSCGSDSQIEVLVDEGCVSVLGVLLSEASMVMMALEGLERVLQVEETRELIRRDQIESGEIEDTEATRTPTLVSASLIEKARESHNSSAVTKRADRIWKQHFVSCALCKNSFSKHRISDAKFCEECKCHVCSNCNCTIYHLDYQEELWAATEEKTVAKKNAKKSKNKKKKAKLKERKAKQQSTTSTTSQPEKGELDVSQSGNGSSGQQQQPQQGKRGSAVSSQVSDVSDSNKNKKDVGGGGTSKGVEADGKSGNGNSKKKESAAAEPSNTSNKSPSPSFDDEDFVDDTNNANNNANNDDSSGAQNNIDFVLYLQQTGSIIALAKLMDALEYAGDDYDEELNDYERKMIREQQTLREQQQQQQHAHQ